LADFTAKEMTTEYHFFVVPIPVIAAGFVAVIGLSVLVWYLARKKQ
jgi:hypothetical protein